MPASNSLFLLFAAFFVIVATPITNVKANYDEPTIDHVRVVIVIDNSSNAELPWQKTSAMLEAAAKFFTFYDRKLLANQTRFVVSVIKVPVFDDPLTATQQLCRRIQKETNLVALILTDTTPTFRGFIDELSHHTAVPAIELFTISSMAMLPERSHFHFYMCDFIIPAVQEAIEAYRWVNMLLIYDTPLNLACVHQLLGAPKQSGQALALAVDDNNFYEVVYMVKTKWQCVVVACDETRTIKFLQLALRMGILNSDYTFIFTNPDIHLHSMEEFAHNQPNVTFFRFVSKTNFTLQIIDLAHEFEALQPKYKVLTPINPSRFGIRSILIYDQEIQLSLPSAMLFDALLLIRSTLESLILKNRLRPWTDTGNAMTCKKARIVPQGRLLGKALLTETVEGVTGLVKFNATTHLRDTFIIEVLGLGNVGLRKIGGFWSEAVSSHFHTPGVSHQLHLEDDIASKLYHLSGIIVRPNKTKNDEEAKEKKTVLKVTTLLEKPYVMFKTGDKSRAKQERNKPRSTVEHNFEGYCIDLLEELADLMDFHYEIRLVADGRYGSYNASNGRWSGMVGEVVDSTAHIAVAPLTITYAREQAVDFTKPFINLGISILYVQPFKTNPSMFSFMQPLAPDVWIAVSIAFLTVTVVFFILGHFVDCALLAANNLHHQEKESDDSTDSSPLDYSLQPTRQAKIFTFLNSAHFTIGGIVHHGSIIAPTTWPTRVISVFWWFFALIIVSSYTANLAAFLTVETLVSPFENAEEMAQQTQVLYGAVKGGATENFFRESKIDTYKKMWAFMRDKDVFAPNNSAGIERVRRSKGGYAYLMESVSMEYIIANDNKDCQLRQVGSLLDSKGYGIATAKDSPIRDRLSMGILRLQEGDRLQLLYDKWWKGSGHSCQVDDSFFKVLELENVFGVFFILIIGVSCSIIALTVETFWYHRKKQHPRDARSYLRRVLDGFRRPFQRSSGKRKNVKGIGLSHDEIWHRRATMTTKKLETLFLPLKNCAECHCRQLLKNYAIGSNFSFNDANTARPVRRSPSLNFLGSFLGNGNAYNDHRPGSPPLLTQFPMKFATSPSVLPKFNKTRILTEYSEDFFNTTSSLFYQHQQTRNNHLQKSHSHSDIVV